MLARSLTFATLLAIVAPLAVADDAPLALDLGKFRPLVVIAPSTADPILLSLNKALGEDASKKAFKERNLVLYSVAGMVGKRDDKFLEQQTTMALIRELALGAREGTQVILVGKDGEKHLIKNDGTLDIEQVFAAVDELPASEKAITAPEPVPVAETKAEKAGKSGKPADATKPAKPAKPLPPPKPLDD